MQQGSGERSAGTPGYFPAPRGEKVVTLLDLDEIKRRWGVSERTIYRAVALGELRAYGRPGRQKYYSEDELSAWVIGRQLSWIELGDDILSA